MPSLLSYRIRRLKRGLLSRLALYLPPFGHLLATPTPLVTTSFPGAAHSKRLVIFLPGMDDLAEDFERRGVIDDMRARGITADAVAVDAHYGYYAKQAVLERITEDIVIKARESDYQEIWLAGISLGGFGAALYASHHASHIDGLLLLAPYLGGEALIDEIDRAGGVRRWEPGSIPAGDHQRGLWSWFKQHIAVDRPALKIHIGYGTSDKFARANKLWSDGLAHERTYAVDGGHDWRTWKTIWQMFLENWESSPH